jgi:hypothetical protein
MGAIRQSVLGSIGMAKNEEPQEVEFPRLSRIIEYFPPGPTVVARDCMYAGKSYSAGSVVEQGGDENSSGIPMECTGDSQGSWKLHAPQNPPPK